MLRLLIIPVVGAFIGWITNVLAIRLIFWPYEPVNIPFTGMTIHGLIPKRRAEIAANIGEIVEKEFFSADDFVAFLDTPETRARMGVTASEAVRRDLLDKLPRLTPAPIKNVVVTLLEETLNKEVQGVIERIGADMGDEVKARLQLRQVVEQRINELEMAGLEDLALQLAAKELGHIKIVGGVLGFLIGLVQAVFVAWLLPI